MEKDNQQTVCSKTVLNDWKGSLTLFNGVTTTIPKEEHNAVSWETVQGILCPKQPSITADKKLGDYFIPCLLKEAKLVGNTLKTAEINGQPTVGKMRSKNHVTEASMLVMDIDGLPESLIKSAEDKLINDQISYLIYTSYSNGNPQKPDARIRIVVPIDNALNTDDYRTAHFGFDHHYFDGQITAKDLSSSALYQQQGTWMTHPDWQDKVYKRLHNAGIASAAFLMSVGQSAASLQTETQTNTEFNLETNQYPPSDAHKVAQRCNQIREFRDKKGAGQSEPAWHDCLGVVGHCENGPAICQEWSSGHSDYCRNETQKKLEQRIQFGPTTCQQFKKNNPAICLNCIETCNSPITLGQPEISPKPVMSKPFDTGLIESEEPWHEPVNPAALIIILIQLICDHIVVTEEQALAVALWILMTWGTDYFDILPLLIISAPEKACGKSQLLDIVSRTVARGLPLSNISPASVYRIIDKYQPALLMDEADTFFKDKPEMTGIINAGHSRNSAFVIRCVGDSHEPKLFPVFGPKAIAGIALEKHLSEATMSRGILMDMRRKLPHEKVSRLRHTDKSVFKDIRRKCARFMADSKAMMVRTQVTLPDQLNDRQQDNWEPLLTIAACIGDQWLEKATKAALTLSVNDDPDESIGIELLSAFRTLFINRQTTRIATSDAIDILMADEEGPWASFERGQAITARQIGKELKRFKIKSRTSKFDGVSRKGYFREDFDDAFARYLPAADAPSFGNLPLPRNFSREALEINELSVTDTSTAEHVDIVTLPGMLLSAPRENDTPQVTKDSEAF